MPTYISKGGAWEAAKEKAVNIKTGEIYEGPDREASAAIKAAGGRMGMKANEDPENIIRARQLGMSVDEYLELGAPPKELQEKNAEEAAKKVNEHKPSPKKPGVRPQGGGVTMSGNFGEPPAV